MSRSMVTTCDICGVSKKDVNHWWIFWTDGVQLVIVSAADEKTAVALPDEYQDACGPKCLGTALDRWVSKGTFDVPKEHYE